MSTGSGPGQRGDERLGAGFALLSTGLLASLVLGGGTRSGFLADVVLQLIAVLVLALVLWRGRLLRGGETLAVPILFWTVIALTLMAQLVPLPAHIWSSLGPRADLVSSYELIGRDVPSLPLSLTPDATALGLLSLVPALVVFLACAQASYRERRYASLLLLAFAVLSVFLGLLQLSQGPASRARLYPITNTLDPVGLFANRNHYAALLYCVLVFAAVWAWEAVGALRGDASSVKKDSPLVLGLLASVLVVVLLLAGQVMSRSRAGLGLTIIAMFGVFLLIGTVRRKGEQLGAGRFVLGLSTIAIVLSAQFGLYSILERLADDPLRDARIPFARHTIEAARQFMPFGAGVGSFVPVYAWFERPRDALLDIYANRAHNDVLELWLETGAVGLALMGIFVLWLMSKSVRVWHPRFEGGEPVDRGLARAATIVLLLLIAHSFFDYPLRTNGIMALAAFSAGLLIRPPRLGDGDPEGEQPVVVEEPAPARRRTRRMKAPVPTAGVPALPAWPDSAEVASAPDEGEPATRVAGDATGGPAAPAPGTDRPHRPLQWGADVEWPEAWRQGEPGSASRPRGKAGEPDKSS